MEGKKSKSKYAKKSNCNAVGVAVGKYGQANAPLRCLLADRASGFSLADDRPYQNQHPESQTVNVATSTSGKPTSRSIALLRKKRSRRNKQKREAFRNLSRKERRAKYSRGANQTIIKGLEDKLYKVEQDYIQEKRLSKFYWASYQKEKDRKLKIYRGPKILERENLKEANAEDSKTLGKGAFGECKKMVYRGIIVAVKAYHDCVDVTAVQWEAGAVSQFDHPGLPLLFGVCLDEKPYLMVTQFHGIDGNCMTFQNAMQSSVVTSLAKWIRLFRKTGEALLYVHKKGFLHNDIKGDNILLSAQSSGLNPVLIDFGKCRTTKNPKKYNLTPDEQRKYRKYHCHIAPELIEGTHSQSFKSDIYAYGFLLSQTCKLILQCKQSRILNDIHIACMRRKIERRPTLHEIVHKLKE